MEFPRRKYTEICKHLIRIKHHNNFSLMKLLSFKASAGIYIADNYKT